MTREQIAAAVQPVESVLRSRPEAGIHGDASPSPRWDGSLKTDALGDQGPRPWWGALR